MRHLDLFSGIGGFALAAQWVWGAEHEIVSFCEIDPFAQMVLQKNFPGVPISKNIFDLKGNQFGAVDIVTGGFPCQPFSTAGKRKGTEDDRYLWPEMLRVIAEAKPQWVIGENVVGIINVGGMVVKQIIADMEGIGYNCWPIIIPACAVGADHRRARVWFLANANSKRWSESSNKPQIVDLSKSSGKWSYQPLELRAAINGLPKQLPSLDLRTDDGIPGWLDRFKALGNAIVPQVAYQIMTAIQSNQ